jgi:hypothetical protein
VPRRRLLVYEQRIKTAELKEYSLTHIVTSGGGHRCSLRQGAGAGTSRDGANCRRWGSWGTWDASGSWWGDSWR